MKFFEVEGLYYRTIDDKSVGVVSYNGEHPLLRGGVDVFSDIRIPEVINYEGTEYNVTRIFHNAFNGCEELTSITIPDSVEEIESFAFYRCSNLKSVYIPSSVYFIDYYVFFKCFNLTSINVCKNNQEYSSINGVLFSKDKTELIQYPCGSGGVYVIPSSVTAIKERAFSDCYFLTAIEIPNSVVYIEDFAFANCCRLTGHLIIPDSVIYIGEEAFTGNDITSLSIGDSVAYIGYCSFASCSNLSSVVVSDSVKTIAEGAFSLCRQLASLTIGKNVKQIERFAFHQCNKLATITSKVKNPDKISLWKDSLNNASMYKCLLRVPFGARELYEKAEAWKDFNRITEE